MADFWSLITSDAYIPFTFSFFLMIGIGLIEAIGLGLGELPDLHLDLDGDVDGISLSSWLGFGPGIPILIWLTSLLTCFTLVGFIGQQLITTAFGSPLHAGWAILGAIVLGLVLNTGVSNLLVKVLPRDETTAIYPEALLLYRGIVLNAPASRGKPSRVKIVDCYGQSHYLPVEPQDDNVTLPVGESVLLVRKEGHLFFGQPESDPLFRAI